MGGIKIWGKGRSRFSSTLVRGLRIIGLGCGKGVDNFGGWG